jgi:hypothetical protein
MEEGMPALIAGNIELKNNLTLTENVDGGMIDHWNGAIRTAGYALTVDSCATPHGKRRA